MFNYVYLFLVGIIYAFHFRILIVNCTGGRLSWHDDAAQQQGNQQPEGRHVFDPLSRGYLSLSACPVESVPSDGLCVLELADKRARSHGMCNI
jgi:hypothetical protein